MVAKNILVTGAGGFIGRTIAQELVREKRYVVAYDLSGLEPDQAYYKAFLRSSEHTRNGCTQRFHLIEFHVRVVLCQVEGRKILAPRLCLADQKQWSARPFNSLVLYFPLPYFVTTGR